MSNELIWKAIVHVISDRIQKAERLGQNRKVEKLRKLVQLLEKKR